MSKNDKKFTKDEIKNVIPLSIDANTLNIKPINYVELLTTNPQPIEYVLYPWLPVQGIAFIYAATGVGKTMLTMNIAYSIASGGSFLKYKCPLPRKVLYIDGEMAFKEIHTRFMQIVKQQGKLDFTENWNLLTPDKAQPLKIPKICDPLGQQFYNKLIEEMKIEVLVLDNLSTLSAIDENNSEQWKVIQDWLIHLRTIGVTVIVVHHAGKTKDGYRGTSRMLDCADTAISLQDVSDNELEKDKINCKKFKIVYQKTRSFGGQDAIPFEVILSDKGWSFESLEISNTSRIIEMYELGIKPNEIALEVGLSRSYTYKIIKRARLQGLIKV